MGGGGGGDANNQPNGVRGGQGGAIVMIRASKFAGSGTIRVNGSDGEKGQFAGAPDGAGGGGAGGTVALVAKEGDLSAITVEAKGGKGGDTTQDNNNEHGPGGGGGGGVVVSYSPNGQVTGAIVSGGANGKANDGNGIPHGATAGQQGITGSFDPSIIPPIKAGVYFDPAQPTKKLVDCGGSNTNGAVVVNLGDLPNATAPGTPPDSYGFIRFRGRVK